MRVTGNNRGPLIGEQTRNRVRSRMNVNIYSIDFHLVCQEITCILLVRRTNSRLCGMLGSPLVDVGWLRYSTVWNSEGAGRLLHTFDVTHIWYCIALEHNISSSLDFSLLINFRKNTVKHDTKAKARKSRKFQFKSSIRNANCKKYK